MPATREQTSTESFSIFSKQIAAFLLEIGAVKIDVNKKFKWASGIESPIYCDNRVINSKVRVRDAVVGEFTDKIYQKYPEAEIIAGVATGGIPYGVLVADRLKLPFIYVRGERKQHGLMKLIEGEFTRGDKVILIEDLISTGGSSLKAAETLREEGLDIICLFSILTYGFKKAAESYSKANIVQINLCNLDTILEIALEEGRITEKDKNIILEFRDQY